jgi:hypothetical protein
MSKRRTEKEINDIKIYGGELGLDERITALCKNKWQVKKLFEIQKNLNERSTGYLYLKQIAPKERVKEYEAAIQHKKLLAEYLFMSRQREALHMLNAVEVEENIPRAKDFLTRNRAYLTEEVEKLYFSKTRVKEIIIILIEYLSGKHSDYTMSAFPMKAVPLIDDFN